MVTRPIPLRKNLIAALAGALGVAGFLNSELFLEARFGHAVILQSYFVHVRAMKDSNLICFAVLLRVFRSQSQVSFCSCRRAVQF